MRLYAHLIFHAGSYRGVANSPSAFEGVSIFVESIVSSFSPKHVSEIIEDDAFIIVIWEFQFDVSQA